MSREFEVVQTQFIKSFSIYVLVVLLAGLALASLVEGLRIHITGDGINAVILYFTGFGAMAAAIYVYTKGKIIIKA